MIVIKNASWRVICLATVRCPAAFLREQSWGLYCFLFVLTTSQIDFPLSASYTFVYADDTHLTFASYNNNCVDLYLNQDLGPVVRKVDKAIQWITQLISLILIQWIVIYPPRAPPPPPPPPPPGELAHMLAFCGGRKESMTKFSFSF